jgi:hypothetical protein
MSPPRFGKWVMCKIRAEEMVAINYVTAEVGSKCGHYSNGICDLAEWYEGWEKDPCPNAEWPLK